MLLSGDREQEVRYLAGQVGISEALFSKSPEEKVAVVAAATKQEKTVFVGDGINDAPAMLMATVGVALGSNSDTSAADALCSICSKKRSTSAVECAGSPWKSAGRNGAKCGGHGVRRRGVANAGCRRGGAEAIDVVAVLNAPCGLLLSPPADFKREAIVCANVLEKKIWKTTNHRSRAMNLLSSRYGKRTHHRSRARRTRHDLHALRRARGMDLYR